MPDSTGLQPRLQPPGAMGGYAVPVRSGYITTVIGVTFQLMEVDNILIGFLPITPTDMNSGN